MSFVPVAKGMTHPLTVEKAVATGSDWTQGALLVVNASDEFAEAGANPTSVAAVAVTAVGPDTSGFNRLGVKGFPPGRCQGIAISDCRRFVAKYSGTLPAQAGGEYGVVRGADGEWRVNFADTTNAVVKLVDLSWTEGPSSAPRVVVEFLDDVVAQV